MKTLAGWFFSALFALTMMTQSAKAAEPKDGRYKGTLTFRTQVGDNAKAEVKKVIPMAGTLSGGKLLVVMTELPVLETYFTSFTFNCEVGDGSVVMRPNNNALPFTLGEVKTTTGAIKGTTDFGLYSPPTGSGEARVLMSFAMTRVGN